MNWKPSDSIMVFTKVAKGFRSGGTNITAFIYPNLGMKKEYAAESLWSYEAGIKTNVWPGLTMNASIYYNDWENLQLVFVTSGAVNYAYRDNAGSARAFGGELEVFAALPVEGLTVSFSGAYNNAEIAEELQNALGIVVAAKGNKIPFSPEWKGTLTTDYSIPLSDSLFGVIRASYTYRSETHSKADNSELLINKDFHQVSASIGVESETWGVHLFANNLFDRENELQKYQPIESIPELFSNVYARPRTIGLRFTTSF